MEHDSKQMWREAGSLGAVGLEMGIGVALGYFVGSTLDGWLDTSPWFTIFWVVAGIAAGFRALYSAAKRARKQMDRPENDERDQDVNR